MLYIYSESCKEEYPSGIPAVPHPHSLLLLVGCWVATFPTGNTLLPQRNGTQRPQAHIQVGNLGVDIWSTRVLLASLEPIMWKETATKQ
jgi:hypothetical protein